MAQRQPHALESKYGLTSVELLDAIGSRFRLKVAVEGAVAEVQMLKHIARCVGRGIERYENHDMDAHPDFSIWLPGERLLLAECKNIREKVKLVGKRIALAARSWAIKSKRKRPARQLPTRLAVSIALTCSRFWESVSARKRETGQILSLPERSICCDTPSTRTNWRSFSGCRCRMRPTFARGMLIYPN